MIAATPPKTQVLIEPQVWRKLEALPQVLERLRQRGHEEVPEAPGRDVQILPIHLLPPKKGLSTPEGQARLLHDLASIELQAMELGVRSLSEFPEAPRELREELSAITLEEGVHLELCLRALENLNMPWGSFPTHIGLWQSVDASDSLLDRLAIVHRYLEGSGLDATETILRRLSGVKNPQIAEVVARIRRDEMGHVQFGSRWYHRLVIEEGGDPETDFGARLQRLFHRVPRRLEPIAAGVRREAGFFSKEIEALEALRQRWLNPAERIHRRT